MSQNDFSDHLPRPAGTPSKGGIFPILPLGGEFLIPACRVSHDRQIADAISHYAFTTPVTPAPSDTSWCDRPEQRRTETGVVTDVVTTAARAIRRTISGRPVDEVEHPTRQHRMCSFAITILPTTRFVRVTNRIAARPRFWCC